MSSEYPVKWSIVPEYFRIRRSASWRENDVWVWELAAAKVTDGAAVPCLSNGVRSLAELIADMAASKLVEVPAFVVAMKKRRTNLAATLTDFVPIAASETSFSNAFAQEFDERVEMVRGPS
jgi:hypothetical protein